MPQLRLPWVREELELVLPDHWTVQQIAQSSLPPAPEDWRDRLAQALSQPSSGEPLGKLLGAIRNGHVVVIVEDITRHSPLPQILGVLMKEIRHAGIRDEQIDIFFATGMHPTMTPREVREKLGTECEGIRWGCNRWSDESEYVYLGTAGKIDIRIDRGVASADLRILISAVAPHLQAGFGGGYKMLLPGCAHLETIRALHRLGISRTPRQLVGTDATSNPMRVAIDRGGQLVEKTCGECFAIQYVLDEQNLPAFIATGDVLPSQRMMSKRCAVVCGVVTDAPADVLIVNAHPLDFDLWQSFKSIANTRWAVRPGGVILSLTPCPAGLNGINPPSWWFSPSWTRRLVRFFGPEALYSLLTRTIPTLAGDAAFFVRLALQTVHRNPLFMVAPGLHQHKERFPGIPTFADPQEGIRAIDKLLDGAGQRVTVFPRGGTTFPVVAPPTAASTPQGTTEST